MKERNNVGAILVSLGRLTETDVERALEHQRTEGGYFGQALLSLDLVSQQELDWVLASQFDLPYVVPSADEVDLPAARLVTREWALAHSALPILKTGTTLSVVVAAPNQESHALELLAQRTGLEIELAVASPQVIGDLVREVFSEPEERRIAVVPSRLGDFIGEAFLADAVRFGVSAAGYRATGWYEAKGRTIRSDIDAIWRRDIRRVLIPPPEESGAGPLRQWTADLVVSGAVFPVEVRELRTRGGVEMMFRLVPSATEPYGVPTPSTDIVSEIGVIVASGSGKFLVLAPEAHPAADLVPRLPATLMDRSLRRIHLTDDGDSDKDGTVVLPGDPQARRALLDQLEAFAFDVVTADLSDRDVSLTSILNELASTSFISALPNGGDTDAWEAGFRWELRLTAGSGVLPTWQLSPLQPRS